MRVLVAEDNPVSRRMLENMLSEWGYEPVMAHDGAEAWQVLQEAAPLLAILDWEMPVMDGLEICRRLRQQNREPYVYVLLLTGKSGRADLVEGMEAGADDYVTKPFDAHELRVRLRAGQRIVELQAELLRAREALREQAAHDALTTVWARAAVLDILSREMLRRMRDRRPVSLFMLDIDRFKQINDTYGHQAGDAVLRQFAGRIRIAVRPYDAIGRYGGEEFLVVLPGCYPATAAERADDVRRSVASRPFVASPRSIEVTCSIGVACAGPDEETTPEALLRAADEALYEGKRNGRNRVAVAAGLESLLPA